MRGLLGLLVHLAACGPDEPAGIGSASPSAAESAAAPVAASGSSATTGRGAPRVVAHATLGARLLTSDGESAYWVDDGSHQVMRAPLAGGAPASVADAVAPTALVVAEADLYFADYFLETKEAKIFKVAKTGGKPVQIWRSRAGTMDPSVLALAVWNGGVYFTDRLTVSKVESGGTDSVVSSMAPAPNVAVGPEGLVIAQRSSLTTDMKRGPGMIFRTLADGKSEPLPSFELGAKTEEAATAGGPLPIDVAVDADGVYWLDAAGSPDIPVRLMALRKNTVVPTVVVARVSFYPDGLIAHEGSLYWRANAAVMKAPKTGGEETLVVRSTSVPPKLDSFTIAGGEVLWVDGKRIFVEPAP